MSAIRPRIAVLNGSLGAGAGNSAGLLEAFADAIGDRAELPQIVLSEKRDWESVRGLLAQSAGLVFVTGTYWDSWGSPMQEFLEKATELEATDVLLGKPVAVLVTMHSVGGKEVLSRLQGVLSTMGLLIPPMSGMVYSLANHLALQAPPSEFHSDLWGMNDLKTIAHNLCEAMQGGTNWKAWEVDSSDPMRRWLK